MRVYEVTEFGIDNFKISEREMPVPSSKQVLVKWHAASVNYRDIMIVEGTYNPRMRRPAIPFSDAAGEIVEVGGDVSRWKLGDRVCSIFMPGWLTGGPTAEGAKTALGAGNYDGVLSEYSAVDEQALVKVPE